MTSNSILRNAREKKALEMRGEEGKRRSYLNLEEERGKKKEKNFLRWFIYLFFLFLFSSVITRYA